MNETLDEVIAPLNMAAEYIDRIAKGDIPPKITGNYKGDFNEIKNNLNICIDSINGVLKEVGGLVQSVSEGKLDQRGNVAALAGDWGKLVGDMNGLMESVTEPVHDIIGMQKRIAVFDLSHKIEKEYSGIWEDMKKATNTTVARISRVIKVMIEISNGDFSDLAALKKIDHRSDQDQLTPALVQMMEVIQKLVADVETMTAATVAGRLDLRNDTDKYNGAYGNLMEGMNGLMEAVAAPVQDMITVLHQYAVNDFEKALEKDYDGIWDDLKKAINAVHDQLLDLQGTAYKIAQGDLSDLEYYRNVGQKSENDKLHPGLIKMQEALQRLAEDTNMLAAAAVEGKLDARADDTRHEGEYRKVIVGVNNTLDAVIGPLNMAAEYMDRISKGDIPPEITEDYNGDFNEIKNNLNTCIGSINGVLNETDGLIHSASEGRLDQRGNVAAFAGVWGRLVGGMNGLMESVVEPVRDLITLLERMAVSDFSHKLEKEYGGMWAEMKTAANSTSTRISRIIETVKKISNGDFSDLGGLKKIGRRSEQDELNPSFVKMIEVIQELILDVKRMADAMASGQLDTRGDTGRYNGAYRELMEGMNGLVEAVAAPVNEIMMVLGLLAVNDHTRAVEKDYTGIWNDLKQAINKVYKLLARLTKMVNNVSKGDLSELEFLRKVGSGCDKDKLVPGVIGMHEAILELVNDTNMLAAAAMEGRLSTRANVTKHAGEFSKVIEGINNMLDAVITPTREAAACLEEMANGNFDVRVKGNYQGDHAIIKNALNTTLDSLHEILKLKVIPCLQEMAKGNLDVAVTGEYKGDYAIIKDALNNTVNDLNENLAQIFSATNQVSAGAQQVSDSSQALSQGAAESASTMEQITASMQEMNAQTKQNAENAAQANQLAGQGRSNAEKGSGQMAQMIKAMDDINEAANNISKIIKAIDEIAFQTNLLALNAAVEAARAGKHGKGFTVVAEEVRNLAQRSAKAAKETAEMIEGSIKKTEVGAKIAEDTSQALKYIVQNATQVTDFVSEIASASKEQALGIEQINNGLNQVDQVTQQNSASSQELAAASEEMSSQTEMVKQMLGKLKLKKHSGESAFTADSQNAAQLQLTQKMWGVPHLKSKPKSEVAATSVGSAVNPQDLIALDDSDFGQF